MLYITKRNGRLRVGLTKVDGIPFTKRQARRIARLRRIAAREGITVTVYAPIGGYRDLATQKDMPVHPSKYNLRAGVKLATAGQTEHGERLHAIDIDAVDKNGRTAFGRLVGLAAKVNLVQRDANGDPHCFVVRKPAR